MLTVGCFYSSGRTGVHHFLFLFYVNVVFFIAELELVKRWIVTDLAFTDSLFANSFPSSRFKPALPFSGRRTFAESSSVISSL